MPVIKALRWHISDGTVDYPVYLGALSAKELLEISEAPSFRAETNNSEIARNILNPPIKNWQRPLLTTKITEISTRFSKLGELMPNPVLLAAAPEAKISITQQRFHENITDIFEIAVEKPESGTPRPLWILDGQHRVHGLAESSRSDNPIPLVLLHGEGPARYTPETFARIFAEVTTQATALQSVHSDWLQFAFRLGEYSPGVDDSHERGMEAVAKLCELQQLAGNEPNPFYNAVQFNPEQPLKSALGEGFAYSCTDLKNLIVRNYYAKLAPHKHLAPSALAEQLGAALAALGASVATPTERSVFTGDTRHRHKPMEDAFLVGALSALLSQGIPQSWKALLAALNFPATDWDFSQWITSLQGKAGNTSRKVAEDVFARVFSAGGLPTGVEDLALYLQGDHAQITLRGHELTALGRARRAGGPGVEQVFDIGGTKKLPLGKHRHLKLENVSANIGALEIRDRAKPLSTDYTAQKLRSGKALDLGPKTLGLIIGAEFYGGVGGELKLTVEWD